MTDVLDHPRHLLEHGLRAAARGLVRRVPPVPTPGLDPDIARVSRLFSAGSLPWLPVRAVRLGYELDGRAWQPPAPDGVVVEDQWVGVPADPSGPARHIPVRSYTPAHGLFGDGEVTDGGALVFCHGGGWAIGSLDSHDAMCRRLAAGAGVQVWAIDYRLGPEDPFPAGVTDVCAAWAELHRRWVLRGGDPARIGIGGDSAGGQAGALVADEAVEPTLGVDVPMPGFNWLIYPGLRVRGAVETMPHVLPTGALLHGPMVARFTEWHVPDPRHRDAPALNQLDRSDEVLAQHPPTWLQSVAFDPLLAENREYVARLEAVGVDVRHEHEETIAHGYVSMTGVSTGAARAMGRAIAALRLLAAA